MEWNVGVCLKNCDKYLFEDQDIEEISKMAENVKWRSSVFNDWG